MAKEMQVLDRIAWKILDILQRDCRSSLTEIARKIAMSLPGAAERMRKLEEAGVLVGYRAVVSPAAVGYGVSALVGITVNQPYKAKFIDTLRRMPEVLECHHVTGADSYVMFWIAKDIQHLEKTLAKISRFGETRTSIVMSSPIERRPIQPPAG